MKRKPIKEWTPEQRENAEELSAFAQKLGGGDVKTTILMKMVGAYAEGFSTGCQIGELQAVGK